MTPAQLQSLLDQQRAGNDSALLTSLQPFLQEAYNRTARRTNLGHNRSSCQHANKNASLPVQGCN
jgi:hypothetical protein